MPMIPGASPNQGGAPPPNSPPSGAAPPSVLAGGDSGAPPAPTDSDEGMKIVVQQIRQMQTAMTDLARQFPAAAGALRASLTGLRAALRQIIANPGSPEPPAPDIGG